jgi:hypothetical protein
VALGFLCDWLGAAGEVLHQVAARDCAARYEPGGFWLNIVILAGMGVAVFSLCVLQFKRKIA